MAEKDKTLQPSTMKLLALAALIGCASIVHAQADEDAAHRQDRRRTAELNRNVAASVARRDREGSHGDASYRAARERYQRELADWSARVDACRAGDWDACR